MIIFRCYHYIIIICATLRLISNIINYAAIWKEWKKFQQKCVSHTILIFLVFHMWYWKCFRLWWDFKRQFMKILFENFWRLLWWVFSWNFHSTQYLWTIPKKQHRSQNLNERKNAEVVDYLDVLKKFSGSFESKIFNFFFKFC